jgi:hypothetical protein
MEVTIYQYLVEVKNEWMYTSSLSYDFITCTEGEI